MTKPIAQRLRETSAQGQDIYGIHCELELEAAGEIERLERDLVAAKADKEHFQNAYVALAQRVSDEPKPLPDFMAGLVGNAFTPELEAEFKRRVEAAGYVYGGIWKPGESLPENPPVEPATGAYRTEGNIWMGPDHSGGFRFTHYFHQGHEAVLHEGKFEDCEKCKAEKSAGRCKERMGFSPLHGFGPQCELPAGHEGLHHVSNSVLNRDER